MMSILAEQDGLIEKNTPRKTSTKEGELISPQD